MLFILLYAGLCDSMIIGLGVQSVLPFSCNDILKGHFPISVVVETGNLCVNCYFFDADSSAKGRVKRNIFSKKEGGRAIFLF